MSLNAIRENKILAKISESSVTRITTVGGQYLLRILILSGQLFGNDHKPHNLMSDPTSYNFHNMSCESCNKILLKPIVQSS